MLGKDQRSNREVQVPTLHASVLYESRGRIRLSGPRPDGSSWVTYVSRTDETYLAARAAALETWDELDAELELEVTNTPPWLNVGDLVRVQEDLGDGNQPFGQVVSFLPVGGVMVVQAGAWGGVWAPEDLEVVTSSDLPSDARADIARRLAGS